MIIEDTERHEETLEVTERDMKNTKTAHIYENVKISFQSLVHKLPMHVVPRIEIVDDDCPRLFGNGVNPILRNSKIAANALMWAVLEASRVSPNRTSPLADNANLTSTESSIETKMSGHKFPNTASRKPK